MKYGMHTFLVKLSIIKYTLKSIKNTKRQIISVFLTSTVNDGQFSFIPKEYGDTLS